MTRPTIWKKIAVVSATDLRNLQATAPHIEPWQVLIGSDMVETNLPWERLRDWFRVAEAPFTDEFQRKPRPFCFSKLQKEMLGNAQKYDGIIFYLLSDRYEYVNGPQGLRVIRGARRISLTRLIQNGALVQRCATDMYQEYQAAEWACEMAEGKT